MGSEIVNRDADAPAALTESPALSASESADAPAEVLEHPAADDAPPLPPSAETVGDAELSAPTPTRAAEERGARRKLTPAQKRAKRNAYLREKRQREKADRAARAVLGIKEPAASSSAPAADFFVKREESDAMHVGADAPKQVIGDVPAKVAPPDTEQLETLIGLAFHGVSRMLIPPKFGGGDLTAEERELLGKAWATPLAPYLSGPSSAFGMAAITTVQIFAMRAITAAPAEEPQQRAESDETAGPPKPAAPAAEAPAAPLERATRTPKREAGSKFNL